MHSTRHAARTENGSNIRATRRAEDENTDAAMIVHCYGLAARVERKPRGGASGMQRSRIREERQKA